MALHHMLRAAVQQQAAGPSDPYFEYNTLLLSGDGTNGAQNNTFLDSSTNNFTITRNGNTTQGSFSPYGNLWSNYFGGSGDYLLTAANTAFNFGTGDFCIEGWYYVESAGDIFSNFFQSTGSGDFGTVLAWNGGTIIGVVKVDNSSQVAITSSVTAKANTWNHIVFIRTGTTMSLFLNGTRTATGVCSLSSNADKVLIGGSYANNPSGNYKGYVSNIRVIKGSNQPYSATSSTISIPTTPLTAVSGTSLLTCQSNRFIDNSSNNFTLTVNGTPSVQRFSPFNPTAPYSAATIGGSGYFDGSGDGLTIGSDPALGLGSGDFTIEAWVYFSGNLPYLDGDGVYTACLFGQNTSSSIVVAFRSNTSSAPTSVLVAIYGVANNSVSITTSLNTWYHVAVTKSSGTIRVFLNGVQQGSFANSTNFVASASTVGYLNTASFYDYFLGYISNFRVVKGTAVYTTTFTPPTAPLTSVSGTSLLTNFTNAGIPDAAMMNDLETVGNAQVSTSVKKYGTGSLAFDGADDCLLARSGTPPLALGSGDFTIEAWVYPTSLATYDTIYDSRIGDSGTGIAVLLNSSGNVVLYYSASVQFTSSSTVSANTWTHIAVVRSGTTITVYINGSSVGTKTSVTTNFSDANAVVGRVNDVATHFFNGYIDDLRITKGYARYTANFTPPTAALPVY